MTLKFKVVLLALLLAVGVASCGNGEEHQSATKGATNKPPAKEATPTPAPATPSQPATPPKGATPAPATPSQPATPPKEGGPK